MKKVILGLFASAILISPANAQSSQCSNYYYENRLINEDAARLRADYPGTIGFLEGCMREARSDGARAACIGSAAPLADFCLVEVCRNRDGSIAGAADFTARMTALIYRKGTLEERRPRGC